MKFYNYSKLFATFYDPVMKSLENKILNLKRKILLKDITYPVLEIGFGTGSNYNLYPQRFDFSLTIIEKSPYMIKKFKKKYPAHKNLQIIVDSIENEELIKQLPEFSSIVSTLTLCSVKNIEKTLQHLKSLLSDEGTLYIMEHIRSSKKFYGNLQDIVAPCWKIIGDGCNLNRKTDILLKQYFVPVYEEYFFYGVDFYIAKMKKIL